VVPQCFSLYRGKRFDLGLYQAGGRVGEFDRIGILSFLQHSSEMTGVCSLDQIFSASRKKRGATPSPEWLRAGISTVWYENADARISASTATQGHDTERQPEPPAISVKAAKQVPAEHKNKFGQD